MRRLPIVAVLALLSFCLLEAKDKPPRVLAQMPKDPVFVMMFTVDDPLTTLDELFDMVGRFGEGMDREAMDEQFASLDEKYGCSVKDDLLGQMGPQIGLVIDLPPIDGLVGSFMNPQADTASILEELGLVLEVRDRGKFDACLRKMFASSGAEFVDEDGMVKIQLPDQQGPQVGLYYGYEESLMAMGLSPSFVSASIKGREKGEHLADGEDFARVLSHLDPTPETLTYVNMPKIKEMLAASVMAQGAMNADEDSRMWSKLLLSPEFSSVGVGSTAVTIDEGVRTTSFGPPALSGGRAFMGIMAATALPNFFSAVDRGKQKRTMADVRSAATACEMYSIDNNVYPTSNAQWVSLVEMEKYLSPAYIRKLPEQDGWGAELLYWSDGESYRIVSPGKDGELDQDWVEGEGQGGTMRFDADIVFGDGVFVQWPEGRQE